MSSTTVSALNVDTNPSASDNLYIEHVVGGTNTGMRITYGALIGAAQNSLLQYGTGDAAWVAAAAAGVPVYVPPGTYTITGNHTFTAPVTFAAGAIVSASSPQTLTFNGGFGAPLSQCFGTNVTAVFASNYFSIGYPEWWGAVSYLTATSSYVDSAPGINAALTACPVVVLQCGAYYINSPLILTKNGTVFTGHASTQYPCSPANGGTGTGTIDPQATQIIITSASNTGLQVGVNSSSNPGYLTENCYISNMTIVRATATVPLGVTGATAIANPVTGVAGAPIGVHVLWTGLVTFDNVFVTEHSLGFYIYGTVVTHFNRCRAYRYTPGINPGNDFWGGYYMDNTAPTGYNSGNASLYFNLSGAFSNSPVAGAPVYTDNSAIQSIGGFTDTYITQFETSNCGWGINLYGLQTTPPDYETEDLIITDSIFDGCRNGGIAVQGGGSQTAVQIQNCYVGLSNATGPVSMGIYLYNIHGAANIQGCQFIAAVGNPAQGFNFSLSSGISTKGNIFTNISAPITVTSCYGIRLEDNINAAVVGPATACVSVTGLTRGVIDCNIYSESAPIPIAVDLIGTGNSYIEVRTTNIDPTYITGGSANKLVSNGHQITTAGAFNPSTGATGSGNCLMSGITV